MATVDKKSGVVAETIPALLPKPNLRYEIWFLNGFVLSLTDQINALCCQCLSVARSPKSGSGGQALNMLELSGGFHTEMPAFGDPGQMQEI